MPLRRLLPFFKALSPALLLGNNTAAGSGSPTANTIRAGKFTALTTGTITEIHAYIAANANFTYAIYSDQSGSPHTLLASTGTVTLVGGQHNIIPITHTPITFGTVYWLAFNMDTNNAAKYQSTGGNQYNVAATFGSAWPSAMTGGGTTSSNAYNLGGWGN